MCSPLWDSFCYSPNMTLFLKAARWAPRLAQRTGATLSSFLRLRAWFPHIDLMPHRSDAQGSRQLHNVCRSGLFAEGQSPLQCPVVSFHELYLYNKWFLLGGLPNGVRARHPSASRGKYSGFLWQASSLLSGRNMLSTFWRPFTREPKERANIFFF